MTSRTDELRVSRQHIDVQMAGVADVGLDALIVLQRVPGDVVVAKKGARADGRDEPGAGDPKGNAQRSFQIEFHDARLRSEWVC